MTSDKKTMKGHGPIGVDHTQPGVGPDSSPVRNKATFFQDSEPSAPVSRRDMKERLGTERGLGDAPVSRKMSTKIGVAPAPPTSEPPPARTSEPPPRQTSEPPPAPPRDKALPWDDVTQDAPVDPMHLPRQSALPAIESFREETTPVGSDYGDEGSADGRRASDGGEPGDRDSSERAQFRTAPGGGKNRVSGGRAAAAAYMSPTTVPPGHGRGKITAAVKVHERVQQDARTFATEPSLFRRRQSSLPPPLPPEFKEDPLPWGWIGGGIVFALTAALLTWTLYRAEDAKTDAVDGKNSAESRNADSPGPKREDAATNRLPPSSSSKQAGSAPAREDFVPEAPAPPAPQQSSPKSTPPLSKPSPPQASPKPSASSAQASPSPSPAASKAPTPVKIAPPAPQVTPKKPAEKKSPPASEELWLE